MTEFDLMCYVLIGMTFFSVAVWIAVACLMLKGICELLGDAWRAFRNRSTEGGK